MSTYRDYQDARDAAWRALLDVPEKKLPIDVDALAKRLGVDIHPFPGKEQERLYALVRRAAQGPCVSLRIRRSWHIFLRPEALDENRRRFAVAHELGHLLLAHETETPAPGVRCFAARENTGDVMEDTQELETYTADLFAVRLLAPACLLHEARVDSSGGIISLCGLPPRAAAIRAERMELLNERDAFYTHLLEAKVRNAFLPWLNSLRFPAPENADVKLRYASEAAPRMEIHASPRERMETAAEEPAPPRAFIPEKRFSSPPRSSRGSRKIMLSYFIRRNQKPILIGATLLIAAAVFYFVGK
ncbi:MAG: ImmA/IrrE family metallo-endopeptidase [Clostridia bacterium]|nr:ImmA/IrrE family metallo-endopeptidase [Clostridia bacterium]